MIASARGHGAGTIVSAVAGGRGASFGLDIPVVVSFQRVTESTLVRTGPGIGPELVERCVARLYEARGIRGGARVDIASEIPVSRGLKSSSAVANTVLAAGALALGAEIHEAEILDLGIQASFDAKVTITGAYDDAVACFRGGVAVADNRGRRLLATGALPGDFVAVLHVPRSSRRKSEIARLDFGPITASVGEAFRLALRGEYAMAMDANDRAYSAVLGGDPDVAERARRAGARAASVSGTGPATVALCRAADAPAVAAALKDDEAEVRTVALVHPVGRGP